MSLKKKGIEINSSFGIVEKKFSGDEDPFEEYIAMKDQAVAQLSEEKKEKIKAGVDSLLREGREMEIDDYIVLISERWNMAKLTEEAHRAVLRYIRAKVEAQIIKKILGQEGRNNG